MPVRKVFPLAILALAAAVDAHLFAVGGEPTPTLAKRQDAYPTGPEYDVPKPISQITALPGDYSSYTLTIPTTWPGGATASLQGAPVLPEPTLNNSDYPTPELIPPENSPEVDEWYNAIDWSNIANFTITANRTNCADPANGDALAQAGTGGRCWWTCGQCTRDVDITTCKDPMQYGHGYDDGPGYYTPKLLKYLESQNLHATFYLVGSKVLYRPEMVRYEYMTGHELSVHTWSHGGTNLLGLTQMTNRQIVAELGWTKKIIKDVTGVTPTTMRPPFGDIDDRVRGISLAMGLTPIIWTSQPGVNGGAETTWDSGDWNVHAGLQNNGVLAEPNQQSFEETLNSSSQLDHGVIALQHDIYNEAVNLAIGYTLPWLLAHEPRFDIKPVMQCQGRPIADMYNETQTNRDGPWYGTGDIATRTSNIGFDEVSSVPSLSSRTYVSTGTGTVASTSKPNAGLKTAGVVQGLAASMMALSAGVLVGAL
ncbi:carbohydrate esterase family 4 protein [Serendipita vermifera MAFF 305830]|uniref:chitin deacetylase n=1 Tax=Serendipita vermifera MAFF 305830 TaxID=933852 RepID=A0A0C2WKG1_SERVB|nr:carbohydrate esterase family 4 protein [Serendipita vermifera MAFF 305830]